MAELRIATRRSALALAQANRVAELLLADDPGLSVSLVEMVTAGDRDPTGPIARLTETGAFVRSVQEAVIDDRADLAVHSLKDLPVNLPGDLVLAAFPERVSPLDALVGSTVDALGEEARVGTGSPRRVAQLMGLRPDLRVTELRGNVDTRLLRVSNGEVDAALLAVAGLERLGRAEAISEELDVGRMVPAPGQGALAVEARRGSEAAERAENIDDRGLRELLSAERALLAETGAGCRSALGALATREDGRMRLDAFVADERGSRRVTVFGEAPAEVVAGARRELGL
ncbi:MAG: hydroxymethylbilane synthase [Acidimicrobiia bacterium]